MIRLLSLCVLLFGTHIHAEIAPLIPADSISIAPTPSPMTVTPVPAPVHAPAHVHAPVPAPGPASVVPVGMSSDSSSSGESEYVYNGHVIHSFEDLKPFLDINSSVPSPSSTLYRPSFDSSSSSSSSTDGEVYIRKVKPSTPPVEITVPPPRYTPTISPTTKPESYIQSPITQSLQEKQASKEASARTARMISGKQDEGFVTLASFITCFGLVALVVIGVYMHRRGRGEVTGHQETVASTSSYDSRRHPTLIRRSSRVESVYDDPLGTRFSSIVMINSGGDGVCIL